MKLLHKSKVDLNDQNLFSWSDSGKTPAYFCKSETIVVGEELIKQLKGVSKKLGGTDVRLCLHSAPNSNFHDMIILQSDQDYYRPHKHDTKESTVHILEGSVAIFAFDDEGEVIDGAFLSTDQNVIFRVAANVYHTIFPTSEIAIYHEATPGPFLAENNSIYPEWAPDGIQKSKAIEYKEKLISFLSEVYEV